MNFEILRNMESFTQDMFNRIIAFQEKEHPAWDETLSFAQRIQGLPLHYLIFSNADRDPATHGPTVAHYYPLKKEMQALAHYAEAVSDQPVILDAHARNGFIGSLLANETRGQVIGLRDPAEKPNQIENFYDREKYQLQEGTVASYVGKADMLLSSWMPSGTDISQDILRLSPKLVVYIFTDHTDQHSGQRQTGTDNAFGEQLEKDYELIDEWQVQRSKDLLHEVWPDLTGCIEETRLVRVYAKKGLEVPPADLEKAVAQPYDWENDLLMAETALAAKQDMMARGFPPENFF